MKKIASFIFIIFLFCTNLYSHVEHYKDLNFLEYELYRNNKLIGFHKYEFVRENNLLKVKSLVRFKISKLGVDLYNYEAESVEVYKNNRFLKFSSTTTQNKKQKYANIDYDENKDVLIVNGSSFKGTTDKNFIVGTWWNHEIIKAKAQISAISGRIIHQNVNFLGEEKITINNKEYSTAHYNFSSSDKKLSKNKKLNTDIWYDIKSNLWIKASFDKTGYWEYRLKSYN